MRTVYFSPMANTINDWVLQSMVGDNICHREKEFSDLLQRIRADILNIVKAGTEKYTVVILTGSGTAALESMCSAIPEKSKVLVLSNGHYGDRLHKIFSSLRVGLKIEVMKFQNIMELSTIEKLIANEKMTHVAMVHHETSTGTLNPMGMIGKICKRRNAILMVDAISSIVMHDIDMERDNISFLAGSSNKGIGGPEGASFVVTERELLETYQSKNYYLDLRANHTMQEKGQTLFTPAVRIFQGLDGALTLLKNEGIENRQKKFAEIAKVLREGMKNLGFELLTLSPSNVASLYSLGNNDFDVLHKILKSKGFIIYTGINEQTFRLCTYGDLNLEDVKKFLEELGKIK